jgi:hypothetical protein
MNRSVTDQLESSLPNSAGPIDPTGFVENFNAGFRVFMDEETSVSRFLNNDMYDERDRQIDAMIREGKADPGPYRGVTGIDYETMSYDLKERGFDIMDDYDVRNNIRETLAVQRKSAQDIHDRATGWGAAGQFAGGMAAGTLDPVNLGSMLIPGLGAIRTASTMARVGKMAAYYGATGAAAETAIQPFVKSWKNEINVDYTAGEMLTNIALAGVGEAVLGTTLELGVGAVKNGFKKTRAKIRETETEADAEAAIIEIDNVEREFDWHAHQVRYQALLDRMKELQEIAARRRENDIPTEDVDAEIDRYNEEEFQKWMDEADMGPVEGADDIWDTGHGQSAGFFPDEAANDAKILEIVAERMDEVTVKEETALNDPDLDNEMWSDLDDDDFMHMSQAERDAYVARALGEAELDGDTMEIEWETGQLDGDGNMQYASRTAEDIKAELDSEMEGLADFMECWIGGGDGEGT